MRAPARAYANPIVAAARSTSCATSSRAPAMREGSTDGPDQTPLVGNSQRAAVIGELRRLAALTSPVTRSLASRALGRIARSCPVRACTADPLSGLGACRSSRLWKTRLLCGFAPRGLLVIVRVARTLNLAICSFVGGGLRWGVSYRAHPLQLTFGARARRYRARRPDGGMPDHHDGTPRPGWRSIGQPARLRLKF
jgi:hypothetical protein